MSLTTEIKNRSSPVSRFLAERFPGHLAVVRGAKERLTAATPILPASEVGYPWMLVGTALDFRLRFSFAPTRVRDLLTVQIGMDKLYQNRPDLVPLDEGRAIMRDLVPALDGIVKETRPAGRRLDRPDEERLCRYCAGLALFDDFGRSPRVPNRLVSPRTVASADDLLALADPAWVDDLCALSWAFYDQCGDLLSSASVLNPQFRGGRDVNGADADLILDGCLIEIKTTKAPALTRIMLEQAIGYALLDYEDEYRIREVGVYMARQGVFLRWPLDALLATMGGGPVPDLAQVRDEFRQAAATSGYSYDPNALPTR